MMAGLLLCVPGVLCTCLLRCAPSPLTTPPLTFDQQGKLKGNDNFCNLILSDSVEREYSSDKGVEMIPLGLYMIKGDNM